MDDLVKYAENPTTTSITIPDLLVAANIPPPDPPKNPGRHRPNRGRKRRYIGPYLAEPPWDILNALGIPLPPILTQLGGVPSQWRRGPRANLWRAQVREMWGTTCHLCGHEGAGDADHLVPLSVWGNQPYEPMLSRMAHGVAGCETCGLKCNSSRGNKAMAIHIGQYQGAIRL